VQTPQFYFKNLFWQKHLEVLKIFPLSTIVTISTKNITNKSPLSTMDRSPMATMTQLIVIVGNGDIHCRHWRSTLEHWMPLSPFQWHFEVTIRF